MNDFTMNVWDNKKEIELEDVLISEIEIVGDVEPTLESCIIFHDGEFIMLTDEMYEQVEDEILERLPYENI